MAEDIQKYFTAKSPEFQSKSKKIIEIRKITKSAKISEIGRISEKCPVWNSKNDLSKIEKSMCSQIFMWMM